MSSQPGGAHITTRKKRRGMIEKRRRDKINNSLYELRRLVPAAFEKQGTAKLEKAEILQMTVDYLRMLHNRGLADLLTNNKLPVQASGHSDEINNASNQSVISTGATVGQTQNTASLNVAMVAQQSQHAPLSTHHQNSHHYQAHHFHRQHQTSLDHHHSHPHQPGLEVAAAAAASSQASQAATAAAMAVASSPSAHHHHLYSQHHMAVAAAEQATAVAAYHHLSHPLSGSDMSNTMPQIQSSMYFKDDQYIY